MNIKLLSVVTPPPDIHHIKIPHIHAPEESIKHMIYNMIVTKDLDIKMHHYIDPWGVILSSVAWEIISYYHHTLGFTPGRAVSGRYMLFNLMSIIN